jgi:cytochrome c peroxidase
VAVPRPRRTGAGLIILIAAGLACLAVPCPASLGAEFPRLRGLDLYRPVPDDNPLTAAKVDLGRRLFNERRLSRDGSRACVSCHEPARAFTNGERFGKGVGGRLGTRNVPALLNRAWGRSYFWDGRAVTLEDQVLQPIVHADELALAPAGIVALARSDRYRDRFAQAFPRTTSPPPGVSGFPGAPKRDPREGGSRTPVISERHVDPYAGLFGNDAGILRQVAFALAAYVRTIQAGDSRYDRYVAGDRSALSVTAQRGLTLFRGKAGCTGCHVGPTFSDEEFHNTGVAWRTGRLTDEGRAAVTKMTTHLGAFKTPTLREVARTAPYMHDGSFATLEGVVDFYDRGGAPNPGLDPQLRPLRLTRAEKCDLVAFLRSLTGKVRDGE